MNKTKNLLFVTWDSESTNYLESLFFPIFKGLQEQGGIRVHVMQFSWASQIEVQRLTDLAAFLDITYVQHPIHRKPVASIGVLWSIYQGTFYIKRYIQEHHIEILMPRSTMPAMMVNRLWAWLRRQSVSLVFDADGFPLEERVDYVGLNPKGNQYRFLKNEEKKILHRSHKVLTRSKRAMEIHVANIGISQRDKFYVVGNGRDSKIFQPDLESRFRIRQDLGILDKDLLWVYTGTVGPQYMVDEMLGLFEKHHLAHPNSKFLILTRNPGYVEERIPGNLQNFVIIKNGAYSEIPFYLSAADLGLSLRKSAPSLAGIAPIKLGEYFLCGLPVIASSGVGDTEEMLKDKDFCFLMDSSEGELFTVRLQEWLGGLDKLDKWKIRDFGMEKFSLEKSVESYWRVFFPH